MSTNQVESTFFRRTSRWKLIVLVLVLVLIITSILSLNVGSSDVPFSDTLTVIGKQIPFLGSLIDSSSVTPQTEAIILEVRLPRVFASILVGAALSAAGVLYQGVFKNPMAESYVLGVSAGAAVGASAATIAGIEDKVGSIQPGLYADLLIISGDSSNPYQALVKSEPTNVKLVFINGVPVYGRSEMMQNIWDAEEISNINIDGVDFQILLPDFQSLISKLDFVLGILGNELAPITEKR